MKTTSGKLLSFILYHAIENRRTLLDAYNGDHPETALALERLYRVYRDVKHGRCIHLTPANAEILHEACCYALQDREEYLASLPKDDPDYGGANADVTRIQAYHQKLFGCAAHAHPQAPADSFLVDVFDLMRSGKSIEDYVKDKKHDG